MLVDSKPAAMPATFASSSETGPNQVLADMGELGKTKEAPRVVALRIARIDQLETLRVHESHGPCLSRGRNAVRPTPARDAARGRAETCRSRLCRPSMATFMLSACTSSVQPCGQSTIVAMPQAQLVWMLASIAPGLTSRAAGRQKSIALALHHLGPEKCLQRERLPRHQGHVAGMEVLPRPRVGRKKLAGLGKRKRLFQPGVVKFGRLHLDAHLGRVGRPRPAIRPRPTCRRWRRWRSARRPR